MPEYLAPGVYVGETSFRARSIEGVATSTTGFVGQCRYGPVDGVPRLITSFEEYQRHFGSLRDLQLGGVSTVNYMAHAGQLFFANGGRRLYVARIFRPDPGLGDDCDSHRAGGPQMRNDTVRFRARFPGAAGDMRVVVMGLRSGNVITGTGQDRHLRDLWPGDIVELATGTPKPRRIGDRGPSALDASCMRFVARADHPSQPVLQNAEGRETTAPYQGVDVIQKVTLTVIVRSASDGGDPREAREDTYAGLSTHPSSDVFVGRVIGHNDPDRGQEPPADRSARVFLDVPQIEPGQQGPFAVGLLADLLATGDIPPEGEGREQTLEGGSDGLPCTPQQFEGGGSGDNVTGLAALGEVDDIAIVTAPGAAGLQTADDRQGVRNRLITHCENLRYRFAILSAQGDLDDGGIRQVRAEHDSKYAALYYPWLVVRNPYLGQGQGRETLAVPPDGAIAGIYSRSDLERGVHKAPANEVVRNVLEFTRNVNSAIQDVLNPEGINCLRFFEGRGYRVWGARTISSDPEWKYLSVRRLFIYLEHSIDRATRWVAFEPNNEQLWLEVRMAIESFLQNEWRTGALMGTAPDQAYFVRCDRTTMSQNDLDNSRLVCLIGVAPTKPAEFMIFRIDQRTADASIGV